MRTLSRLRSRSSVHPGPSLSCSSRTKPDGCPTAFNPRDYNENGGGGVKKKPPRTKDSQARVVAFKPISKADQMAKLARMEAINKRFLRSQGLFTFQLLRENQYRCSRKLSQENAETECNCSDQERLFCGTGCLNRMLRIECDPLCSNGERCTNKCFQQQQCWPCRVFRTEKKGCGVTAELAIPAGELIIEYMGEVIDSEEFRRRQHRYSKDRNRHYYFMALRGEAIIDATMRGNISRYINHSCDPNAETQKWTVNGELRIGVFSLKNIMPGEEITFDYQYQRYGRDAERCYCEAANCRGWLGNKPEQVRFRRKTISTREPPIRSSGPARRFSAAQK